MLHEGLDEHWLEIQGIVQHNYVIIHYAWLVVTIGYQFTVS